MYAVLPTRAHLRAPVPHLRRTVVVSVTATSGGPVARFRLSIIFHVATRQWALTVRAIGRLWTPAPGPATLAPAEPLASD
jgi:hypothetical protein